MTASDQSSLLEDVGLEEVTRQHLQDWGIVEYRVYRAEPGDPFEEVDPSQDRDLPLHHEGRQTIIVCETPSKQSESRRSPEFDEPREPLHASADVRWFFRKNEECEPLRFEGYKHNPWRHDDIIFHIPYLQFNPQCSEGGEAHAGQCCGLEVDNQWCFDHEQPERRSPTSPSNPKSFIDVIRQSISLRRSGGKDAADEEQGALWKPSRLPRANRNPCFESKAFTSCMLPTCLDGRIANDIQGPDRKGRAYCKSWVALVVAPKDIIWKDSNEKRKLVNDRLLDGNLADRINANGRKSNRPRFGKERFKSPRDAYYFQTCLIEAGIRLVAEAWDDNVSRATRVCHDVEKSIHSSIHSNQRTYWRRGINDDLLGIYKLQKRLEFLEANLFNNITNPDQDIWNKFRIARPGLRLEQLDREEEEQRKLRRRKGKAQRAFQTENDKGDTDILERQRLHFLLYGCVDRYWNRLYRQRKKLRQKIDDLQALRQLLTELSQTRASLYANDLGDNVAYLTYISILFLPLSFCTSLWAMNHEFPYDAFIPTICGTSAATAVFLAYVCSRLRYRW